MRTGTWKADAASGCQRRMRTGGASGWSSGLCSRWDVGRDSGCKMLVSVDGRVTTRYASGAHEDAEPGSRPETGCGAPKVNTDSTNKRMDKTCSETLLNMNFMLHGIRLQQRKILGPGTRSRRSFPAFGRPETRFRPVALPRAQLHTAPRNSATGKPKKRQPGHSPGFLLRLDGFCASRLRPLSGGPNIFIRSSRSSSRSSCSGSSFRCAP